MDTQGVSLKLSKHAIERLKHRSIRPFEVEAAIRSGEVIESYLEVTPFPEYLVLGMGYGRHLHVVVAYDEASNTGFVVTAYQPSDDRWMPGFKVRRKP